VNDKKNFFLLPSLHDIDTPWGDVQTAKELKTFLDAAVLKDGQPPPPQQQQQQQQQQQRKVFILQCILTENAKLVIEGVLNKNNGTIPHSLYEICYRVNPLLQQWLADDWKDANINVVLGEFLKLYFLYCYYSILALVLATHKLVYLFFYLLIFLGDWLSSDSVVPLAIARNYSGSQKTFLNECECSVVTTPIPANFSAATTSSTATAATTATATTARTATSNKK
jgi:hypothetical protein